MALVKDPYQAGGISGSIGGATFANYKGMTTVRNRAYPPRRMRSTQPRNRSIMGMLSREYGRLSAGDRELWESYAADHPQPDKFGGTFIMSGINAYIKLSHSISRLQGWAAVQDEPPVASPPASVDTFTAVTGATNPGEIDLDWGHAGTPTGGDFNEIYIAGPFQSPARQAVFDRKTYLLLKFAADVDYTVPNLVEGMWYWFYIRYVDAYGQVTAYMNAQATPKLTP